MLTINAIRKTALRVRRAVIEYAVPSYYDRDLAGACGVTAAILTTILTKKGIIAIPLWGEFHVKYYNKDCVGEHAWVWLPDFDRILDISATQFGKFPKVWLKATKHHQNGDQRSVKWLKFGDDETYQKVCKRFRVDKSIIKG